MLRVKGDKIKMMQKELRKAMTEAAGDDEKIFAMQEQYKAMTEAAGDDEKIFAMQEQYKAMTSLRKKISAGLGGRIVL